MASKLETLNAVLVTQIETTSIETVHVGYSHDSGGKLIAELTWGGGENRAFGGNVTHRNVILNVRIKGAEFDQVDSAVEEVMVLFQDTTAAPFLALSAADVDWIGPAREDPPVVFPSSHQTAIADVQFDLRIHYP